MRTLLLALLIALLSLRGWLGDAMAMGMAAHELAAAVQPAEADPAAMDSAAMDPADCPGHAASADRSHSDRTHSDCAKCSACDVCHGVALSLPFSPSVPAAPQAGPVPAVVPAFASAVPPRGDKPPIA